MSEIEVGSVEILSPEPGRGQEVRTIELEGWAKGFWRFWGREFMADFDALQALPVGTRIRYRDDSDTPFITWTQESQESP